MVELTGKKVVIFGHSIATSNGGGTGIPEPKTYGGLLRDLSGCVIYRNAIAGSNICSGLNDSSRLTHPLRYNALDVNGTPDIILIDAGINDYLEKIPLGVFGDTTIDTFYGGLDVLYRALLNKYKTTRIFHKTPLHTSYVPYGPLTNPENNTLHYLYQYVEAIEKVSFKYGVSIIPSFQDSGITYFNVASLAPDQIHIGEIGHKAEYELIKNTFNLKLTNLTTPQVIVVEDPPVSSVVFDIKSNNVTGITYNETTNVLTAQTNSVNYEFALTNDCNSAVITMPANNPVALPAFVIGNDAQENAIVLYFDGSGSIKSFKKSGVVNEITQITTLDTDKPFAPKGTPVTITHGTDNVTISYGSYTRNIPYSLIPELTTKSIGCLFTGAGVSNYTFDKIS